MKTYKTLDGILKEAIIERLKDFRGNVSKTAQSLDVARSTVQRNVSLKEINTIRKLKVVRGGK